MSNRSSRVIKVADLSVDYMSERGATHAISHVSFELEKGKIVALVGESGCGKSTLALSMIRLLPSPPAKIAGGHILFGETDMVSAPSQDVQRVRGTGVAMIFQEPLSSLNPVLKIRDQLAEAILVRRIRESHIGQIRDLKVFHSQEKTMGSAYGNLFRLRLPRTGYSRLVHDEMVRAISLVRIADPERILSRYPFELSGGMRQRVMIAMALSQSPSLLIADEPTSALDVTTQAQVLQLIRELVDKVGTSVLIITHDLGVAAQVADRVIVMYAGEVVEDAEVNELFARPLHPYTKALLECLPKGSKNEGKLGSIPGSVPDLRRRIIRCPFVDRCSSAFDRCRTEHPQIEGDEKHSVACFLYQN